jgi:hypothetical protein
LGEKIGKKKPITSSPDFKHEERKACIYEGYNEWQADWLLVKTGKKGNEKTNQREIDTIIDLYSQHDKELCPRGART